MYFMRGSKSRSGVDRVKPGGGEGVAIGKYARWLTEDGLLLLKGWARDGLTDEQIAKKCHITAKTLRAWKKQHSPICTALKEGKEVPDRHVENALYKISVGYSYDEITWERVAIDKEAGIYEMVETKRVRKEVAPNVVAQIYWLKNRKRDMWKESHDRYEIDRERLELERRRVDAEIKKDTVEGGVEVTFSIENGSATIDEALG